MDNNLLKRITHNPDICHGKPCIRGLRYPVEFILELLSSGMTVEEILEDYEDLHRDDILATLLFNEILGGRELVRIWAKSPQIAENLGTFC